MNDKVSIVIAAFNEEKNIEKCLQALLSQTYQNIEIIVVDDGSVDNTLSILKEFEWKYSNVIKIMSIKNSGVSHARNLGMSCASGEWILFSDADDYYYKDAIEKMLMIAGLSGCYIVQGGLNREQSVKVEYTDNKTGLYHTYQSLYVQKVLLNYNAKLPEECDNYDKYMRYSTHGPYAKLIKKTLLDEHKICFNEIMGLGEDLLFYFSVLDLVEDVALMFNDVYVVNKNPNSSTHRMNARFPAYTRIFTMQILKYITEHYDEEQIFYSEVYHQIYMHVYLTISSYYLHPDNPQKDLIKASEMRTFLMNPSLNEAIFIEYMDSKVNGSITNKVLLYLLSKKYCYLYIKMTKCLKSIKPLLKKIINVRFVDEKKIVKN